MEKHRSVKIKSFIWAFSIIFFVGTIMIAHSYKNSRDLEFEGGIVRLEGDASINTLKIQQRIYQMAEINREFSDILMSIRNNDEIYNKREKFEKNIEQSILKQPSIIGYNIVMEPNAFDGRDSDYINNDKYAENGQDFYYEYTDEEKNKQQCRTTRTITISLSQKRILKILKNRSNSAQPSSLKPINSSSGKLASESGLSR